MKTFDVWECICSVWTFRVRAVDVGWSGEKKPEASTSLGRRCQRRGKDEFFFFALSKIVEIPNNSECRPNPVCLHTVRRDETRKSEFSGYADGPDWLDCSQVRYPHGPVKLYWLWSDRFRFVAIDLIADVRRWYRTPATVQSGRVGNRGRFHLRRAGCREHGPWVSRARYSKNGASRDFKG